MCKFLVLFNYRDCIGIFTSNEEFYVFDTLENALNFIHEYDEQFYCTKIYNKID